MKKGKWNKVDTIDSSRISCIKWAKLDPTKPHLVTMRIVFKNGAEYEYYDVEEERLERLLSADSVGKAFQELIVKPGITYNKL